MCTNGMINPSLIFTDSLLKVKGREIEKGRAIIYFFGWDLLNKSKTKKLYAQS